MAYRRRQQQQETASTRKLSSVSAVSTSWEANINTNSGGGGGGGGGGGSIENDDDGSSTTSSLAARAIRASSGAHRDSSLSSAYGFNHPSGSSPSSTYSSFTSPTTTSTTTTNSSYASAPKDLKAYEYTSMKNVNESKQGFWSSLARKAKSIIEDDIDPQPVESPRGNRQQFHNTATKDKFQHQYNSREGHRKPDGPILQKGLKTISSSLNYIGNAVEEGLTIVENRTADMIQGTRRNTKKPTGGAGGNQPANASMFQQPQMQTTGQTQTQTDVQLQLKASRDVAMAMAAKAKLLLRELKTVKADLAFAKERCFQLEEENRILRESRERGDSLEDDDLIRLQLETLLAEKARLAHENSVYARENRFLREVVEYHQLTMQDVVYLDEGTEEVTEVYPIKVVTNPSSVPDASFPSGLPTQVSVNTNARIPLDMPPRPVPPPGVMEVSQVHTFPGS